MSGKNYNQNLMMGAAAVVAGVLGTLSALMRSNRSVKGWTEQAKDAAVHVWEGDVVNKNMMLGGLAGGLIGAATALLLAPKAGTDLIRDLTHPFSHQGERKRSSRKVSSSSRKSSARKRGGARSAKSHATHHETGHAGASKSHKPTAKKKSSSARRRTASAKLKQAATVPEKAISKVAESLS